MHTQHTQHSAFGRFVVCGASGHGADDAHSAPVMIAAEKAGKQQFVADIAADHKRYLDSFYISHDNGYSSDRPENTALAQRVWPRPIRGRHRLRGNAVKAGRFWARQ